MKRLFVFIMMSMWGVGNVHAAKIHELQISVIDKESGNPVQGIRLVVSGHTTQKAVCFTDANGRSIHQWEGSRKDIRIAVEDTSGVYRNTNRYLAKAELRKGKIHVKISLRRLPDYSVLFAEFREIDREIDERNRTNGVDITVFDGDCERFDDPEFSGGVAAMQQYIAGNVEYPHEAIEMNEQGRVYLSFIIEMDGTISHVKVERGVSDTLDYEAVRLLYRMPKWIFGSCSGEPVRTKGRLPISFTLN